jgi:hypothetical protein
VIRLYALVEGISEYRFVQRVLAPHLAERAIWTCPLVVSTSRAGGSGRKSRGGGRWKDWARDLRRLLAENPGRGARFTTMFDLYGLPHDFPGFQRGLAVADTARRADLLQDALHSRIRDHRLVPYVQRHEFEALVFACLGALRELLDPADLRGLDRLRKSLGAASPEDIDDGESTAPSKRIRAHIPGYRKVQHGPLAIEAAGLAAVRRACPRFDAWVGHLERLAEEATP